MAPTYARRGGRGGYRGGNRSQANNRVGNLPQRRSHRPNSNLLEGAGHESSSTFLSNPNDIVVPPTPTTISTTNARAMRKAEEIRRAQLKRDENKRTKEARAKDKDKRAFKPAPRTNDPVKLMVSNPKLRALLSGKKMPREPKSYSDAMIKTMRPHDLPDDLVDDDDEEEKEKEKELASQK